MKRQLTDLRVRSNSRRGGVMKVPPILDCDTWEALASVSQDKLIEDSFEDREDRAQRRPGSVVTRKDPADVTDRYKPGVVR